MNHLLPEVIQRIPLTAYLDVALLGGSFIVTAVISYLCSKQERHSWSGFWRHCLPLGAWRQPSARADIWFYLSMKLIRLPILATASIVITVGVMVNRLLQFVVGFPARSGGGTALLILFTLTMVLINDLARYSSHYLQHRIPILWELHKTHHSAEAMAIFTTHRAHPLELLIAGCFEGLIGGIAYGVWLFFAYDPVEVAIFGISIYRFFSIVTLNYIQHAPYKVSYGTTWNKILMAPHYHHLHHSAKPEHWNKNFGFGLSCWDGLFGTLMAPKPNEDFIFGLRLTDRESEEYHSWWRLYVVPFVKISRMIRGWVIARVHNTRLSPNVEGAPVHIADLPSH
jgi:sterol desaturase/sphingolipid hydroxylase (fatty acid hydroxylase superfamily)